MATPRGTFAPELLPEGWFDETQRPEGWFSQDFLEVSSPPIEETVPAGGGGIGQIGYSIKPTKVYRPFDRDIEAIQDVLERAERKPVEAKPKRKREIIRAVVNKAVDVLEAEGLPTPAIVRQELKQAAFELIFPRLEIPDRDDSAFRAAIQAMLEQAAEAAYQQQLFEYEQLMAFEADEDEALCLLLAS